MRRVGVGRETIEEQRETLERNECEKMLGCGEEMEENQIVGGKEFEKE